jgi:hypothetical protein
MRPINLEKWLTLQSRSVAKLVYCSPKATLQHNSVQPLLRNGEFVLELLKGEAGKAEKQPGTRKQQPHKGGFSEGFQK